MKKLAILLTTFAMSVSPIGAAGSASASRSCRQLESAARNQALARRAETGDSRAATCLAVGLRSLDGGELEDALVALGRYGDRRPVELLLLTHRGTLSKRSLTDAVRALPLSLSDQMGAQLKALQARSRRFRNVTQPRLMAERKLALESIQGALADIRSHN